MTSSKSSSAEFEFESKIRDVKKKRKALERPPQDDIDKLFASFAEQQRKRLMEFQHKYNFNFVNGVPLPEGRYEWYPVDSSHEDADPDSEKTASKKITQAG